MDDWQKLCCLFLISFGIMLFQPMNTTNIISAGLMIFPSILLGKEVLRYEQKKELEK
jgi:hypothetical protein